MFAVAPSVRVGGPLAGFSSGLLAGLVERGYSPGSLTGQVRLLALLSRWMERAGLSPANVNESVIAGLVADHHAVGEALSVRPESFRHVLAALRTAGPTGPAPTSLLKATPLDDLLDGYRAYLTDTLGLSPSTIHGYSHSARRMLTVVCDSDPERLGGLNAADISRFVVAEAQRGLGAATVTTMVVGVRSLLRWCYATDRIATPLAQAAPWLSRARMSSLPRTIAQGVSQRLLDSCDRSTLVGCRDYAALVMFCRLGLRVGELVAVRVDDIDWRKGELVVRSKGGWRDPLPLPVDVGDAIAIYLRERGPSRSRQVFIQVRAPWTPLNEQAVKAIVRRACERIEIPVTSTHCLRHSVASDLLREGSNLAEIGQVLRHREVATTAIYAKVDHSALAGLAQPWPVSAS